MISTKRSGRKWEEFLPAIFQESDELSANARIENRRKDQQLSELERLGWKRPVSYEDGWDSWYMIWYMINIIKSHLGKFHHISTDNPKVAELLGRDLQWLVVVPFIHGWPLKSASHLGRSCAAPNGN